MGNDITAGIRKINNDMSNAFNNISELEKKLESNGNIGDEEALKGRCIKLKESISSFNRSFAQLLDMLADMDIIKRTDIEK
jgi:hypothetical protein